MKVNVQHVGADYLEMVGAADEYVPGWYFVLEEGSDQPHGAFRDLDTALRAARGYYPNAAEIWEQELHPAGDEYVDKRRLWPPEGGE